MAASVETKLNNAVSERAWWRKVVPILVISRKKSRQRDGPVLLKERIFR